MIFQVLTVFPPAGSSAGTDRVLAYYGWRYRTNPGLGTLHPPDGRGHALDGRLCLRTDLRRSSGKPDPEYDRVRGDRHGAGGLAAPGPVLYRRYPVYYPPVTWPSFRLFRNSVVLLVATNSYHFLYYSAIFPRTIAGSVVWVFVRGPLFWLHVAYSYLLLLIALIFLASRYSGARQFTDGRSPFSGSPRSFLFL